MQPHPPPKPRTAPDLTASVISNVVNPILVPPATTAILLILVGASIGQALAAFSFIGFAFCLVPLADIFWMISRGSLSSLDLPTRANRTEPVSLTIAAALIGLVIYYYAKSSIDLVSILSLTYVANLAVVLIINLYWKISVHCTAIGGMLGIVLCLFGPTFGLAALFEAWLIAVLVVLVPLVMWARVQLQMHTPAQVIAGAALGFAGHWAGYYYMTKVWF